VMQTGLGMEAMTIEGSWPHGQPLAAANQPSVSRINSKVSGTICLAINIYDEHSSSDLAKHAERLTAGMVFPTPPF
jgi:hypothetical protein